MEINSRPISSKLREITINGVKTLYKKQNKKLVFGSNKKTFRGDIMFSWSETKSFKILICNRGPCLEALIFSRVGWNYPERISGSFLL